MTRSPSERYKDSIYEVLLIVSSELSTSNIVKIEKKLRTNI
jgi:hypothetical protein